MLVSLAGIGILFTSRSSNGNTESASSGNTESARAERHPSPALGDLLHEFERTDAAEWIEQDHFRAIVYVVMKTVPERRQGEALNDLLVISKLAPNAWNYIREPRSKVPRDYAALKSAALISQTWGNVDDIFLNLEFETPEYGNLPKGPKDSFRQFVTGYVRMSKDCSSRGITVEAEAKNALGE